MEFAFAVLLIVQLVELALASGHHPRPPRNNPEDLVQAQFEIRILNEWSIQRLKIICENLVRPPGQKQINSSDNDWRMADIWQAYAYNNRNGLFHLARGELTAYQLGGPPRTLPPIIVHHLLRIKDLPQDIRVTVKRLNDSPNVRISRALTFMEAVLCFPEDIFFLTVSTHVALQHLHYSSPDWCYATGNKAMQQNLIGARFIILNAVHGMLFENPSAGFSSLAPRTVFQIILMETIIMRHRCTHCFDGGFFLNLLTGKIDFLRKTVGGKYVLSTGLNPNFPMQDQIIHEFHVEMNAKAYAAVTAYEYIIGRCFYELSKSKFGSKIIKRKDSRFNLSMPTDSPVEFEVNLRGMTGFEHDCHPDARRILDEMFNAMLLAAFAKRHGDKLSLNMTANIIAAVMAVNLEFGKRCVVHNYNHVYFNDLTGLMEVIVPGRRIIEGMVILLTPVGNLQNIMRLNGVITFTVCGNDYDDSEDWLAFAADLGFELAFPRYPIFLPYSPYTPYSPYMPYSPGATAPSSSSSDDGEDGLFMTAVKGAGSAIGGIWDIFD